MSGKHALVSTDWLRRQRIQVGISQQTMADLLGVHRTTVNKWEMNGMVKIIVYYAYQKALELITLKGYDIGEI
jgi:DNA-binding XRE family transcriptional regulator